MLDKKFNFEKSYVVDDHGLTHDSIKDTANNLTVCSDVDEDYEQLILLLPEVYEMLDMFQDHFEGFDDKGSWMMARKIENLLEKARGER